MTIKAVKVDSNRNPILVNGKFQFVYDQYAIAQNCDQAMRQELGELNFDKDKGVEYLNNLFTGSPNFQRFEAQARAQILAVDGVTSINSFEYELLENTLNYSVEIYTEYGTTTFSNV